MATERRSVTNWFWRQRAGVGAVASDQVAGWLMVRRPDNSTLHFPRLVPVSAQELRAVPLPPRLPVPRRRAPLFHYEATSQERRA